LINEENLTFLQNRVIDIYRPFYILEPLMPLLITNTKLRCKL